MNEHSVKDIAVTSDFWKRYQTLAMDKVLPYEWEALSDLVPGADAGNAIHNLKLAAGRIKGGYRGFVFHDSDLYKWLEAAGYALMLRPDADLEARCDGVVDLIAAAHYQGLHWCEPACPQTKQGCRMSGYLPMKNRGMGWTKHGASAGNILRVRLCALHLQDF